MGFKRDVDEPAHNHIQPSSQHSPAIWGRPGSAIPLYDYDYLTHADNGKLGEARVCTPHTHTDCLLLYKPPLFCYEYITKTVSGDQKKSFVALFYLFLYKRSPDR